MTEAIIINRILHTCCQKATRLFRNNVGQLQDKQGRIVRYGVCNPGGSDLIGWTRHTITPADVGRTVAIFTAVEVKYGKTSTKPHQKRFLAAVQHAGGIAGIVRSAEEAAELIGQEQ